ncbi:hypothetical protein HPP92_000137 [Vanilla planifolia]|uniref:E3 ubiquitin-protein ligase LIN-1 n=1 Tax=Vanilla planifolia TaxID=51239 RepID=A0A835VK66_VANPL|nr:hypothetical protein HPP92_000137 [Vanilla planifolia]
MHLQLLQGFEKVISTLCPSEGSRNHYDADCEITTMWQQLHHKEKLKYCSTKHEIVDHLLNILSSSKEEKEIRVSVSILLVLVSEDKTTIEDIKKKSFHLYSLAMALKRNVHEAAILIYLLNPSPSDIRSLELLPTLVEIACSSNGQTQAMISLPMTPTSASIAIIEVLVTAFDYVTNNMHLAAISSPRVLSKLVNVAMNNGVDEGASLATILMNCMRLNGNCRKFLSQVAPVEPFIQLLRSGGLSAKSATLDYFQELLCVPRSTSFRLLHQIRQVGRTSIMPILIACVRQDKNKNQLFAANLLLQLDMLEGTKGTKVFRQEAVGALIEAVVRGDDHSMQSFSSFLLSNLGGTFSWTGESYTAAWLLKKAGLTSACHRNMVRDIDWLDPCLQGSEASASSRMASKVVIEHGRPVFCALAMGIQSQTRSVQRDCLIACAWLASEMSVRSSRLRNSACEILLDKVASFLHPGTQFDERVLACLTVYNYTSGKGKWKLLNFSEGIRESLRRLSGVTWMAEEMLNVTNYVLPTKPRVSCVHTQTLEIVNTGNGSATAIIFFKGNLYTGYSDGSIKVWNIRGQQSMLIWEVRKTRKLSLAFLCSKKEIDMKDYKETEIRAATTSWKIQKNPINSICVFKGWVYCAGASIEASRAMIFLREKQQSVGRLSAGSKVTSLLTANDVILCGTEAGLVKVCMIGKWSLVSILRVQHFKQIEEFKSKYKNYKR